MNASALAYRAANASEVLALVRGKCLPLMSERVPLSSAAGRVLREAVCAPEDQPAFDRSSMDGYAVRLDDPAGRFRIVDEIRAGDWKPRPLQSGEAVRIATGGALPCDGLQVLPNEDVQTDGESLTVLCREPERNIRFRGEDAQAGAVLVEAGTRLEPGTLGLLASLGCSTPLVTRWPRVCHVATGNEIVSPDQAPGLGQIRDSNSTLICAFLGRMGILPQQQRVPEEADAAKSAVCSPAFEIEQTDLLLISGGASVGKHDFTRRLLEELGFAILVSRTTARPGKPLIVAQRGPTLAFGLPGNPLAHFVCLNLYVRVALEGWAGARGPAVFQDGVLESQLATDSNARETFWPARWRLEAGRAVLRPLPWNSSGDLTPLASANALLRVPSGVEHLPGGAQIEFAIC